MKRWNINIRVLLVALVPALSIALLLSFYFARTRLVDLEQSLTDRGLAIARQLAPAAEFGVFSGNREVLDKLVAAVANEIDVTAVTIRDEDGNLLANSQPGSEIPPIHGMTALPPTQSELDEGRVLVSSAPILQSRVELEEFFDPSSVESAQGKKTSEAKVLGRAYVAVSRAALTAQRERVFLDTLVITLLIFAANVFLAVGMSRNVSRPLVKLTKAVQQLADGDLDTRVTPDSDGVLRALEDGVNTMAAALKSAHADLEQRIADATVQLAQKKEEAERANDAKSLFLAAASHDLRQPLHALGLFVASLHNQPLSDEARRIVAQIEKSVFATQDLLDALLDISRLDASVVTPKVSDFPVYRLQSAMEINFAPSAIRKGLSFRSVPCSAMIRSDPILLERIVLNLVSNAVRYTARGKILLGCRRCENDLRIEVWDTGPGIPENQLTRIFEEFYQIPGYQIDEERGLGLGLAIVDRMARLLGHRIDMRSAPGRGSMFAVYVPLAADQEAGDATVAVETDATALGGMSVMVIDDDPATLKATKTLLESWGCRTLSAASGLEARSKMLESIDRLPQLIICDYFLSRDETGIQALDHLRKTFSRDFGAIVISADTSAEVMRAVEASGYALLYKPLRPAKLRALTLHFLARSQQKPR